MDTRPPPRSPAAALFKSAVLASFIALMAAVAAPAYAGHWVFTDTSSGSATVGTSKNTYTAPTGPSNNTITVKGIGIASSIQPSSSGTTQTITATANLSVVVKGVWTSDLTSDNTQPPSVLLSVKSSSTGYFQYSGPVQADQADDGYHDPTSSAGVSQTPGTIYPKAPGIPIVITLSLSAKATATNGLASAGGTGATVSAMAGPITISVHPQPYNFRSSGYDLNGTHYNKSVQDNTDAILALSYIWSSTDGINADLTTCTIAENVTWNSNPAGVGQNGTNPDGTNYYAPPSPPVGTNAQGQGLAYPNPTITQQPATRAGATDTFSPDASYIGPYKAISWWGDQTYVFNDTATGEVSTPLPGPAAGTFRITRKVTPTGSPLGTTGGLTISTRGYSAGPAVLD